VRTVTRRPVVTVLLVVVALGTLAIPAKDLRLALSDNGSAPAASTQRQAFDLVAEHFGPGYNAPLLVTADIIRTTDPVGVVNKIADELRALPRVTAVTTATPNRTADTGVIALAPGATLDFEVAKSYVIGVSAYDGYRRSATENVTINVFNLNDNPPVITAGQSYRIDGGHENAVARVKATDADDTNQPGFTTFSGWAITSGNTNSVFRFSGTGELQVGRPLLVDWRKSSYVLGTRVGDGTNTSAIQAVEVTIPNRVNLCLANSIKLEAPKSTVPLLILLGAELGTCR